MPATKQEDTDTIGERAAAQIARLMSTQLAPGLYLVATPIGNLGDITLRALAVLAGADAVYCEDTRHSGQLLHHFGIQRSTRSYHEHNAEEERPRLLKALQEGKSVALISDAGTPLVSDPGYKLVRDAAAAGHPVISIPGSSAVLAALGSSGLPTDAFLFAGFLPAKETARRNRIRELSSVPGTLMIFESPSRLAETLTDLAQGLGNRPAAVARELTKLHEEVLRASLEELAREYAAREVKGEIVIVVGPPTVAEATDEAIRENLARAMKDASLRDAARIVSEMLGVAKSRVYDIGLGLKRKDEA